MNLNESFDEQITSKIHHLIDVEMGDKKRPAVVFYLLEAEILLKRGGEEYKEREADILRSIAVYTSAIHSGSVDDIELAELAISDIPEEDMEKLEENNFDEDSLEELIVKQDHEKADKIMENLFGENWTEEL